MLPTPVSGTGIQPDRGFFMRNAGVVMAPRISERSKSRSQSAISQFIGLSPLQ